MNPCLAVADAVPPPGRTQTGPFLNTNMQHSRSKRESKIKKEHVLKRVFGHIFHSINPDKVVVYSCVEVFKQRTNKAELFSP